MGEYLEASIKSLAKRVEGGEKEIRKRLLNGKVTYFFIKTKFGREEIVASGIREEIIGKGNYEPKTRESYFTQLPAW